MAKRLNKKKRIERRKLLLMGVRDKSIKELEKDSYNSSKFSSMLGGGLSGLLFGALAFGTLGAIGGLVVGLIVGYLINRNYFSRKSNKE
jgi:uncharacterized membrane protein YebE (DUF533 family)